MRRPLVSIVLAALASGGCSRGCSGGPDRSDGTIPQLRARRFARPIAVDGRASEPDWESTGDSGPFVSPGDGKPRRGSPVNARARVGWDGQRLYVLCTVDDAEPASPFSRDDVDPHIWAKASGIELMVQPGDPGDNRHYYEIQVDVAGALWDTRFDDYNRPIAMTPEGRRYGHQDWVSGAERAVAIDRSGGSYTIELAVPWKSLSGGGRAAVPPKPGDAWRINLYRFRDGQRAALAWSPTLRQGNFHRSSRFGRIVFVD